ncbi:hypothetical protein [Microtetraspora niveoalba]|uniref:hypothetical protein n=1 Tax=Microtetraspora niveoalba TaxID=46175 RepID=UPI0008362454|nr:hypothetical protein [Microtetraspora niveoalba]
MLRRLTAAALADLLIVGGIAAGLTAAVPAPAHAAAPACAPGDCFTVSVSLDRAPAVGQNATLTVEVVPKQDVPDAMTTIELPDTLRWVRPPAGLDHTAAMIGRSPVDRASRTERARRGKPVRFEGVVTAVTPGPASIYVRARDERPGPSSEGLAYLTIGEKSSTFGLRRERPSRPEQTLAPAATLAGDTCVRGRVTHVEPDTGAVRGTPSVSVEVWDKDEVGSPDLLGKVTSDATGGYRACFPGIEEDGTGQDVYLMVSTVAPLWTVEEPGTGAGLDYFANSAVVKDVPLATDTTIIDYAAAPGDEMEGAFRIMARLHDAWSAYTGWLGQPGNDCWKPGEAACQRLTVKWKPDVVVPLSHYCPGVVSGKCTDRFQIHLDASEHLEKMTVAHEVGHFIMDYTYGHMPPTEASCSQHYGPIRSGERCAWTEGWADWFAVQTYGDTHYRWKPTDPPEDMESPTWFTQGWDSGADVEGRVAGALLDLADSGARNEKYWDVAGWGPAAVVAAFRKAPADTVGQFVAGLSEQDRFVAKSVLFQNTISEGHRYEDVFDRKIARWPANVPMLPVFATTAGRWSVVAAVASPASGGNVDLDVYPPDHSKTPVGSSDPAAANADFVAVQPASADDALIASAPGDADHQEYALEVAEAPEGDLEKGTPMEVAMGADRLVEIRTTRVEQGVPATFTVTPQGGQDVDLFVMAPDSGTWGLPRSKARRSAAGGPGKAERVTIADPKVSGVYAVIVIRRSGEGTLTLSRA